MAERHAAQGAERPVGGGVEGGGTWRTGGGRPHYRHTDGVTQVTTGWGDGLRPASARRHATRRSQPLLLRASGGGALAQRPASASSAPRRRQDGNEGKDSDGALVAPATPLPWLYKPPLPRDPRQSRRIPPRRSRGQLAARAGRPLAVANLMDMGEADGRGGAFAPSEGGEGGSRSPMRWAPLDPSAHKRQYPLPQHLLGNPAMRLQAKTQYVSDALGGRHQGHEGGGALQHLRDAHAAALRRAIEAEQQAEHRREAKKREVSGKPTQEHALEQLFAAERAQAALRIQSLQAEHAEIEARAAGQLGVRPRPDGVLSQGGHVRMEQQVAHATGE